ncbi:hypothetical protein HETIRDRAFT_460564 [Heterobasidion irregulare TC 32-1]|uniref:RING-type domain-containing protein n=1 Tax=Heterobasidion irregulare (strain TC 32-1) TaxID=747525 RepID=W4JWM2_HETIT|nr:uncharacterized protein HETIRDRAFT_460564 [Heterobasidion irregulare TC 32-1]ETW77271.1 hypothetical protein HETIRDRAFT_460564 [Heterobasidion irregulare TC 32-1]
MPSIGALDTNETNITPSNKRARTPDEEDRDVKRARVSEDAMGGENTIDGRATQSKKDKRKRKKKKRRAAVIQNVAHVPESGPTVTATLSSLTSDNAAPDPAPSAIVSSDVTKVESPEFVQGSSSRPGSSSTSQTARAVVALPNDDVAQLTQSLSSKTESLRIHEELFSTLLPSLTCQICISLLYKPYALSPCGHVACYDCLRSWFTTPAADNPVPPNALWRKKTCPTCRAEVLERPAEVWNLKDMVAAVAKSGLALGYPEAPAENPPAPGANAEQRDPWHNIFRRNAPGGHHLPHLAQMMNGGEGAAVGMYDVEDNVYRCLDCMHEIWQGVCSECGREYAGYDSDDSDSYGGDHGPVAGFLEAVLFGMEGVSDPEDYEEHYHDELDRGLSDEDSYDGSFIDDGVDAHAPERGNGNGPIEISSDEDSDDEIRALGRILRGRASAPIVVSDEEADTVLPSRSRGGRAIVESDEDVDELASDREGDRGSDHGSSNQSSEEDDGSITRPPRHLAHLLNPSRPLSREEDIYPIDHYDHYERTDSDYSVDDGRYRVDWDDDDLYE